MLHGLGIHTSVATRIAESCNSSIGGYMCGGNADSDDDTLPLRQEPSPPDEMCDSQQDIEDQYEFARLYNRF